MLGWLAAQRGCRLGPAKRFGFAGFMLAFSMGLAAIALSFGAARAEGIRLGALQIPADIPGSRLMASQAYVSEDRWISVGVSAGALATVALTAAAPRDLAAAIAFAPGRGSSGPDAVGGEKQLVAALAQYGGGPG